MDAKGTAGAPLYIVLNAGSGRDDADVAARQIAAVLTDAAREHDIIRIGAAMSVEQATCHAVTAARRTGGVVVGAGGDGTLNAVAHAAHEAGLPFGVIPQGTFNYFARTHGIPEDAESATRVLLDGRIRPVPVGLVNEYPFLVNASLGLYPETLEERELQKQRHGRRRSVAVWATLLTLLQGHRPMRLRLETRGQRHELATLTLFVGLNPLQLQQAGLDEEGTREWEMTAVVLKPVSTARLLWLMLKGALGELGRAHGVDTFRTTKLRVTPAATRAGPLKLATDGETHWAQPPLEFRIASRPLRLLVPARTEASVETPD